MRAGLLKPRTKQDWQLSLYKPPRPGSATNPMRNTPGMRQLRSVLPVPIVACASRKRSGWRLLEVEKGCVRTVFQRQKSMDARPLLMEA